MTGKDLAGMYEFSFMALNRNLNDLKHEDSIHIPERGGNCINLGQVGTWGRRSSPILARRSFSSLET